MPFRDPQRRREYFANLMRQRRAEGKDLRSQRAYRQRNLEKCRAASRNYMRSRKAENAAAIREWQTRNPEAVVAISQRRRARIAQADGAGVTTTQWKAIVAEYSGRCAYCGALGDVTMDHVVPLCRGGEHDISNIVPACGSCNSSKGRKLLTEWMR